MTAQRRSRRGRLALMVLGLLAVGGAAWLWQDPAARAPIAAALGLGGAGTVGDGKSAAAKPGVAVLVAEARRMDLPVRLEALGTVESMFTVPIRSRVAASVTKVGFADGAAVREGDLLFQLDARVIDTQIQQAEATLARDKAQLDKARRDVTRYADLATRNAISKVQVEDAATTVDVQTATVAQDEANLQSLKVQRSYYEIRAPVTGRLGVSSVRAGTVIRVDDILATVRQVKPIYVAFGVPERYLGELRAAGEAAVSITLQGSGETVEGGHVAVIDNTVDPQTGTLIARAVFPNADERLWPGTLGSVVVTLRLEKNVVAVPTEAVQQGQVGSFVFVVKDAVARVRPVKVARSVDGLTVLAEGLDGGETVVTDGQLSLRNGSRVSIKSSGAPGAGS